MRPVTVVAYHPIDGWYVGTIDAVAALRDDVAVAMAPWPYTRLLLLCSCCDEISEAIPDLMPPFPDVIPLGDELSLIPDTGQTNVAPAHRARPSDPFIARQN